jgi:hypothetical protein
MGSIVKNGHRTVQCSENYGHWCHLESLGSTQNEISLLYFRLVYICYIADNYCYSRLIICLSKAGIGLMRSLL